MSASNEYVSAPLGEDPDPTNLTYSRASEAYFSEDVKLREICYPSRVEDLAGVPRIMKDRSHSRQATRKGGLTITTLDDEILVYDPETMRASCLNNFAAEVLALCDGQRSAPEIARDLPFDDVDERVVWLALADLEKAQLLRDGSSFASNPYVPKNRRAFMKKLALGSAVAVPIVVGITLPTAAQCASAGVQCMPPADPPCCSGNCVQTEVEGVFRCQA